MPLFKNGEWIVDPWRFYPDDQPIPAAKSKIVTLARLRGDDGEFLFHCGCALGVRLESHEEVEELEPWLDRLSLIALVFPKFADGRAFSTAAILRQRYGFHGEVRAVGNILVDQHPFMRRVGFDAFEVAPGRPLESWKNAHITVGLAYQYDDATNAGPAAVWRARRGARPLTLAAE